MQCIAIYILYVVKLVIQYSVCNSQSISSLACSSLLPVCGLCCDRVLGVLNTEPTGVLNTEDVGTAQPGAGVVDASARGAEPQDSLKTGAVCGGYTPARSTRVSAWAWAV